MRDVKGLVTSTRLPLIAAVDPVRSKTNSPGWTSHPLRICGSERARASYQDGKCSASESGAQSHRRGICSILGCTEDSTSAFADSGKTKQSDSGRSRLIE